MSSNEAGRFNKVFGGYFRHISFVDSACEQSLQKGLFYNWEVKRIRPFLDNASLISFTPVQFCLHLIMAMCYGIHVLSTPKTRLQRLQNRAARVIRKSSNLTSSDTLLAQLNWCKLETRPLFHKAILMYKCQNNEIEGVNTNLMRHL